MMIHGSRLRVVAAAAAMVLAALFWWFGLSVVIAQEVPPHVFVGTAIVDGKPMADGKSVTAWINGHMVAESVIHRGAYILLVVEPVGRSFHGEKISFKIGDFKAREVGYWELGGGTELILTAAASGSIADDSTPVQEGSPGQTTVDCAQSLHPACQDHDGGQHVDGAFQDEDLVIPEARLMDTTVGGEQPPTPRQIPLTSTQKDDSENQILLRLQELERQRAEQNKKLEVEQVRQSQETDRQETSLETRRLELKSRQELEQQRISRERQRADREAQLELERQRLEPEYPDLGIFRIEGRTDQDRKPAGGLLRRNRLSGRGFFTNSASGDAGGFDRALDPTTLAVIGILLTLVATSTSLFKGN